ncbi:unnamed protein product [Toxocara canis]|uniref:G protein-coupled receptor n=1 Tax=Toxocara canis TaxID=6265 RepID=A0A183UFJ7_TOXCA|nr:unnamed protein product [Toxocara canis]
MVDLSDIFIGVINLILVLIPSVPYVVILVIFYRDKDSYGGSYEIMFHLGISDCLQLFCLTPSWATHFMDSNAFPFTLNKVFGALLAAGWINSVNFTLLLAINRLVLLFGGKRAEQFFEGIGLNIILAICWLSGAIFGATYLTPVLHTVYDPQSLTWIYTGQNPYLFISEQVKLWLSLIETALTFIAYVVIVCCLCCNNRLSDRSLPDARRVHWNPRRDLNILLQLTCNNGSKHLTSLNSYVAASDVSLFFKILYRDKDSRGGSYKIMFHLGIADCIQLICFTPSWLCHLMDEASFPFALNKFFGALLNAGWVNYVHFTLLLSINRLVILFFGQRAEIFFNEMGLTVTLIALWLSACVLAAAYLTPVLNVIYEPENLAWNYSGENPYVTVAEYTGIEDEISSFSYRFLFRLLWLLKVP